MLQVPLPTWKAIKDRVLKQIAESKLAQAERTAHWEKKEQVRADRVMHGPLPNHVVVIF
jgi:hypothetical protein